MSHRSATTTTATAKGSAELNSFRFSLPYPEDGGAVVTPIRTPSAWELYEPAEEKGARSRRSGHVRMAPIAK